MEPLEKQGKDEIKNMFNWIKKSKNFVDQDKPNNNGHCNNYSSHCCLSCDKCWGGKYKQNY